MTAGDAATRKDVAVFVAGGGNGFMTDIAMWLVEAAAATGRAAKLIEDRLPDDPNLANLVVAPHELYVLSGADERAVAASCRISIPVCTEQPGTSWFRSSVTLSRPAPFALDINAHGVEALRSQQVLAERLLLGGVESMVAPARARDVDVLFLGGDTPRRRQLLATLAPVLQDRPADLRLFRFTAPVRTGAPGLVFGTDKYRLLASAKLLVNIHRDDRRPGYFEWARMVEAMANGCVVVTEPCAGAAPLRPGEHFVETDDLAATVAELLEGPARRDEIAAAAAEAVLRRHPLAASHRSDPRADRPPRPVRPRRPAGEAPAQPDQRATERVARVSPGDGRPRARVQGVGRRAQPPPRHRVGAGGVAPRIGRPHHRAHDAGVRARPGCRHARGQRGGDAVQLRRTRHRDARVDRGVPRRHRRDRRGRRPLVRRRRRRGAAVHGAPVRRSRSCCWRGPPTAGSPPLATSASPAPAPPR